MCNKTRFWKCDLKTKQNNPKQSTRDDTLLEYNFGYKSAGTSGFSKEG